MNQKINKAAALAALSTLKIEYQVEVTDEELAAFIDKTLDESQRKRVLSALAKNPALLSSAVDTFNALQFFDDKKIEPAVKPRFSLTAWLKQHWLSSGSLGSFVAAAFAYIMLMPVTNLNQLDRELSRNFNAASVDATAFYKQLPATKSLNMSPVTEVEAHFRDGYQQALNQLELADINIAQSYCNNEQNCEQQRSYQLLGRWTGLTLAQCHSPYSVSTTFWQTQGEILDALLTNIKDNKVTDMHKASYNEQLLCVSAGRFRLMLN